MNAIRNKISFHTIHTASTHCVICLWPCCCCCSCLCSKDIIHTLSRIRSQNRCDANSFYLSLPKVRMSIWSGKKVTPNPYALSRTKARARARVLFTVSRKSQCMRTNVMCIGNMGAQERFSFFHLTPSLTAMVSPHTLFATIMKCN